MRRMTSAIKKALKDDPSVGGLAKSVTTDVAPQDGELPNIVISLLTGLDSWTQQGPMNFHRSTIRVTARSMKDSEAAELGAAVYDALQNYSGVPFPDVQIDRIFHRNTVGDYTDGSEIEREIHDFEVRWRRI